MITMIKFSAALDIDEEGKKLIIKNMRLHMSEASTQIQALRVLLTLAAAGKYYY